MYSILWHLTCLKSDQSYHGLIQSIGFDNTATDLGMLNAIPRLYVEGLSKILDFDYFVLIWWHSDKKQQLTKNNHEAELQGPFYFDKTANF